MFPLLRWNQLHWNSIIFSINQSLTFIEHLLIPGSWFGLKLYATPRVCHFQNCPSRGIISGWVRAFYRSLKNSGTTHDTEHNSLPPELGLYPRSLSFLFFHAGIKEQCFGPQYLLWPRIMMSVSRALLPPFWCPNIQLQGSTLSTAYGYALSMFQGLFVIWATQWKDNASPEKGCPVSHFGRHTFHYGARVPLTEYRAVCN